MSEEVVLIIAGGDYQYRRWMANNQLLGKEHLYRHIKDEEGLRGYWDNRIICIGTPHTNSAYNCPKMALIQKNYKEKNICTS